MRKISILLVIIWMIVIFTFSQFNGNTSSKQSNGLSYKIARIIHYEGDIQNINYVIRKIAHFIEYLILGVLVFNACKQNSVKDILMLSVLICILYASLDELHQIFISSRNGNLFDVCIDSLGSMLGIFILNRK